MTNHDETHRVRRATPRRGCAWVLWILMGVIVAAGLVCYASSTTSKPDPAARQPAATAQLVRGDSHRLTSPAAEKAQLVDFECESWWGGKQDSRHPCSGPTRSCPPTPPDSRFN